MELFKMFFDGNKMNDVPKITGFKEIIDRDYDIRGIVLKYPNSLTLFGDAYTYLITKFRQDGFCSKVNVELQAIKSSNANDVIKGIIFLSDIKWDWDRTQCEVTIEDDSWSARLINNMGIGVNVKSTFTKNGEALTPAPLRTIETYDPNASGGAYISTFEGFDIRDVLRVLIEFVSDGFIGFESQFLEDADPIALTTGLSLRTTSEDTVVVSLREVLTNISKLYNLWFDIIDNGDGTYTFKLEEEEYFYSDSSESFSFVKGIVQSTFVERLYGSVAVGSDGLKSLGAGPGSLDFYILTTHLQEQFYVYGDCNVDEELDLVNTFVYDTNAIEDIVLNANSDFDSSYFLVEYNETSNRAVKYKYASATSSIVAPFYYNKDFLNINVLKRYSFQNSLLQTFGDQDNSFEARLSTDSANFTATSGTITMIFDDEVSDPNANYNPVNGRYTAPLNGTYSFETGILVEINTNLVLGDSLRITVTWTKRTGGGTIYESVTDDTIIISGENITGNAPFPAVFNIATYMEAGSTLDVRVLFAVVKSAPGNPFSYRYVKDSYFKTLAVYDGGGTFFVNKPAEYKAALLECQLAIPDEQWINIKSNKSKMFTIDRDGANLMSGWIKTMERDFLTGVVETELVTNLNQIVRVGS